MAIFSQMQARYMSLGIGQSGPEPFRPLDDLHLLVPL